MFSFSKKTSQPCSFSFRMLDVAGQAGIDEALFRRHYSDGTAEAALQDDLFCTARLGIRSLPACLIQRGDKALLMQSFAYEDYASAIEGF